MTPHQQSRLLELFANCSQQSLTESEHRELQCALHADTEARKLWFLYQDLELGLKCLTQISEAPADHNRDGAPLGTGSTNTDAGPGIHLPANSTDSPRVSFLARRNRAVRAGALLCVSAMVIFGVCVWRQTPDSYHAVESKIANSQADDFIVESPTHGTKFKLSDHQGKVIALHFLLKTECPSCLKLVQDYAQLEASNPDVVHLFLKPDSINEIKVWSGKISRAGLNHPPLIYRDPDARLAKEFGIPDGYKFHGQTVRYPALVLLDSSGKEIFRYVGKNNTDRMKPDEFTARMAMLTSHK